jgi:spore germination cell wall hydrolase CwlJ-like protein
MTLKNALLSAAVLATLALAGGNATSQTSYFPPERGLKTDTPQSTALQVVAAAPNQAPTETLSASAAQAPDAKEVDCIAKVVVHEAGNQPFAGKVAVAQVIRNRLDDGRFGATACSVVNQPRQFFNTNTYFPNRETKIWKEAVQIATDTLNRRGAEVVPGALYFNSVGGGMPGRKRLGQIGGHVFYR